MSDTPRIVYTPRPDTTPEVGVGTLAPVFHYILECYAKKNPAAGPSVRGDYDGKTKEDSADESNIQDRS
jgi:hypothetical protein